jgi:hypothetical protein
MQSLNERLETIDLSHDFKQKFTSLDEVKRWKASEKQNFFLHAILPVRKDIFYLFIRVFYHHSLLVTDQEIDIAEAMLLNYTRLLPEATCLKQHSTHMP